MRNCCISVISNQSSFYTQLWMYSIYCIHVLKYYLSIPYKYPGTTVLRSRGGFYVYTLEMVLTIRLNESVCLIGWLKAVANEVTSECMKYNEATRTYVFLAWPCLKHIWPTRAADWSPRHWSSKKRGIQNKSWTWTWTQLRGQCWKNCETPQLEV